MRSKSIIVMALFLLVITTRISQATLVECLYGSATQTLVQIDPLDGSYTTIISGNYPTFNGLAYTPEPSTLLVLGLGAVMFIRKREKSL